jgi:LmbE family N-acetylglucosaminyl deacetylase
LRRIWIAAAAAGALAVIVLGLLLIGFSLLHRALTDESVPTVVSTAGVFAPGSPKTVMAVWAHPDDEVTSAGTLARLAHDGAKVTLVYFTHGEGAHFTGYTADQLYRMRPQEAKAAGRALGVSDVVVLDYGDGKLPAADSAKAKADLAALIAARRPSTVFSFDERVGYYGHADHAQVGRWTAEVVRAGQAVDPAFPVRRLYQATLPSPVIALARKYISAFRTHYPTAPGKGLPLPTLAVPIASEAAAKRAVLDAHRSQVKVIDDVQPYGRKLPAWLYYRLFDREYFTLAAGR